MAVPPPPPTELLEGKYVLGDLLGAGGMGLVYRASQPALQRTVAVKILRRELRGDRRVVDHFHREALAIAHLTHPNLVAVFDVGETDDGLPFLVMEYVPGRPLGEIVRDHPISVERACSIGGQILAGLGESHRAGIVHADVKADNVLVEVTHDGSDRVKVVDFGLARGDEGELADDRLDDDGEPLVSGTPEYMAPEVIRGGAPTPATDLYGVGVIVYELLTGTTPFGGGTAVEILSRHLGDPVVPPSLRRPDRGISRALEEILARALAKRPVDRFQDAEEFAAALAVAGRAAAAVTWCQACGSPIARDLGYCTSCSASLAWASAAVGSDADTQTWRPPGGGDRTGGLRGAIASEILRGDPGRIASSYLDLATALETRGDVVSAIRELQEGMDVLTGGDDPRHAAPASPVRRLAAALTALRAGRRSVGTEIAAAGR